MVEFFFYSKKKIKVFLVWPGAPPNTTSMFCRWESLRDHVLVGALVETVTFWSGFPSRTRCDGGWNNISISIFRVAPPLPPDEMKWQVTSFVSEETICPHNQTTTAAVCSRKGPKYRKSINPEKTESMPRIVTH